MGVVKIIFEFIKAIPLIISLIREIAKVVNQAQDAAERRKLAGELKDAMTQARTEKDTSKLEGIFKGGSGAMRVLSAAFLAAMFSSCGGAPIPKWDGKIYAGSSAQQAMVRKQENEVVLASDPKFDDMLGMTYADFLSFTDTYIGGCKEWKPGVAVMSQAEVRTKFKEIVVRLQALKKP
jgi:hypothetical protein